MITIPLYSILIIYIIYLLACAFFILINIGHLTQTASLGFFSYLFTLLILLASILVLWYTYRLLSAVDWQQGVTIFNQEWFGGIFTIKASL